MSYLKTKENDADVTEFLNSISDDTQREDSIKLLGMIEKITDSKAKMWGKAMVGFGNYTYKTKAGKVGEWFYIGFSPRKQNLSLHLMFGLEDEKELLAQLGKHTTGKGCLYIKRLEDVDTDVLQKIMTSTYNSMKNMV
ncbi:DUF1801 domain-containing protein [Winogradskyella sp. 3972H.M.0a.05]|uniref:DUF1801 domain-containing protein n=1 Tax=Winogradskyella sp. 3972H.M.0a.05 TaxID=2950277 RepID=UPI003392EB02